MTTQIKIIIIEMPQNISNRFIHWNNIHTIHDEYIIAIYTNPQITHAIPSLLGWSYYIYIYIFHSKAENAKYVHLRPQNDSQCFWLEIFQTRIAGKISLVDWFLHFFYFESIEMDEKEDTHPIQIIHPHFGRILVPKSIHWMRWVYFDENLTKLRRQGWLSFVHSWTSELFSCSSLSEELNEHIQT